MKITKFKEAYKNDANEEVGQEENAVVEPVLAVMERVGLTGRRRAVIAFFLSVSRVSLGVGKLPEKTEMMLDNLPTSKIIGI